MAFDWSFALVLAATSLGSVVAALFLLPFLPGTRPPPPTQEAPQDDNLVFLFDNETLLDVTAPGRAFLDGAGGGLSDWQRLCARLEPRFPGFQDRLSRLAQTGSIALTEAGGTAQLAATWMHGVARITLHLGGSDGAAHADSAMMHELTSNRAVIDALPIPAWRCGPDGAIGWANRAYIDLIREGTNGPLTWPLPALFPEGAATPHRVLRGPDGQDRWFDCSTAGVEGDAIHFAVPADAAVRAETTLQSFMQTLTKTFAELPIGLAVFNRTRELVLFNPAMSELFNLDPEFLIARPTLRNVLDRLREDRMMPEPKDYRAWRQAIERLERDAENGIYADTWTLPSGAVYRVTGRPHPDGAVAFLFEDISAEMSLTRRFRGELETGQAVLDTLEEAIAVFSNGGMLTLSNSAYAALWGDDPTLLMGPGDIAGATAQWQAQCLTLEDAAHPPDLARHIRQRTRWIGELVHCDGHRLACRIAPIAGGAVLVGFRRLARSAHPAPEVSFASG
ncbi:PAS-domain containing protein [Rhodovulum adriaticum]|uniref:PAS domain-containing protein n=1 Tax=Rhodovulum adriaticum TaxID=35804 RepID=A0A4R2NZB1_RHOAD|nr:PAS-domain containing protein [Rhodovulum adriaticum]TCP27532.1 PAS domain-containing protein [Rhodovulum adriaticum]